MCFGFYHYRACRKTIRFTMKKTNQFLKMSSTLPVPISQPHKYTEIKILFPVLTQSTYLQQTHFLIQSWSLAFLQTAIDRILKMFVRNFVIMTIFRSKCRKDFFGVLQMHDMRLMLFGDVISQYFFHNITFVNQSKWHLLCVKWYYPVKGFKIPILWPAFSGFLKVAISEKEILFRHHNHQ